VGGNPPVGVLALQGDFQKHIEALEAIGVPGLAVRRCEHLDRVERLIIPGGESTTVSRLLSWDGLGDAIVKRSQQGMPIWGTCMGLIVIARTVTNHPVPTLGLFDGAVERNGYGSQLDSFEAELLFQPSNVYVRGVFIRAPIITSVGPGTEVLVEHDGRPVGVRQGHLLGTTFHPELTDDPTVLSYFLRI
jgi:pyridoxal 5'-phosphate synthase pdxT subunit